MVIARQQADGEKEERPSGTSGRMQQRMSAPEYDDTSATTEDASCGGSDHVILDWSKIQGKLFGRQDQQQLLQEAFRRKVTTNQRELVLVTGSSGTGKTALARTLSEHSDFFIHGKFDQLQKPSPYFALVQAVGDFINLVVEKGEVETVKEAIESSLEASEIAQLVHSIPDLGKILKTDAIRISQVSQNRFIFAFCKLIGALCSKERPLVLFLDDLQWSDAGSLEVVEALTRDTSIQEGLVILGCCRGDEVKLDDHLSVMLRSLDSNQIHITDIQVTNLPREEVDALIAEVLHDRGERE
jgi:predicted ATPase